MPSTTRSAGASGCRRRVASYRRRGPRRTPRGTRSGASRWSCAAPRAPSRARRRTRRRGRPPRSRPWCGAPGRGVELGHLAEQRRRQVVDDEEPEVLEGVRGLGPAGARQPGDDREAVAGWALARGIADRRVGMSGALPLPAPGRHRQAVARCVVRSSWTARATSGPTPGVAASSSTLGGAQPGQRTEPLEQRLLARGPDAGDVVERRVRARASRAACGGRRRRSGAPRRGCAAARTAPRSRAGSRAARARRGSRPPRGAWRARCAGSDKPSSARTSSPCVSWPRPPSTTISAGGYENRRRRSSGGRPPAPPAGG